MIIFEMYFNHIVNKPIISEKKLEENSFTYNTSIALQSKTGHAFLNRIYAYLYI